MNHNHYHHHVDDIQTMKLSLESLPYMVPYSTVCICPPGREHRMFSQASRSPLDVRSLLDFGRCRTVEDMCGRVSRVS